MMKEILTLCFGFAMLHSQAQKESVFKKDFTKPEATEVWEPKPKNVTPGIGTAPPSDAIVLFDGKNMDKWVMAKDGTPPRWVLDNGVMTVKLGDDNLQTKQKFWRLPTAC